MRRACALAIVLLLPLAARQAPAQLSDSAARRIRYGVIAGWDASLHRSDFVRYAGPADVPYSSHFSEGSGSGINGGVFVELPIGSAFGVALRASYMPQDALLTTVEQTTVIVGDTATAPGEFERRIQARLRTIGIEPTVQYRLPGAVDLAIGARVGFVMKGTYESRDVMTIPERVGVFENGRRVRYETSGDIADAGTQIGIVAAISRELPMDRRGVWTVAPEVSGLIALTPVAPGFNWYAHAVRIGLALKASPLPAPPPPPPPVVTPPPPPVLAAEVGAIGVLDDGTRMRDPAVRVEEFVTTRMQPLLNYVFFDEASAAIPSRYRLFEAVSAGSFSLASLHGSEVLESYYQILNIVGQRMQAQPPAKITLTGTTAGSGNDGDDPGLARRRAEAVKDYLTTTWGIPPGRIAVASRTLPAVPSDTSQADGRAEDRRVEITTSAPGILDPIITEDTVRQIAPSTVLFTPLVRADAGVDEWSLSVQQGPRTLVEEHATGFPPDTVDWDVRQVGREIAINPQPVTYQLQVRDHTGATVQSSGGTIPVEGITVQQKRQEGRADVRTDRYGLILFEYDRADLNEANRRLAGMIRGRIEPAAHVAVNAYTDRLGEEAHNMRLSQDRAAATARALGVPAGTAKGFGESVDLYDNDLPEGRFYSRTVEVIVETPVH